MKIEEKFFGLVEMSLLLLFQIHHLKNVKKFCNEIVNRCKEEAIEELGRCLETQLVQILLIYLWTIFKIWFYVKVKWIL